MGTDVGRLTGHTTTVSRQPTTPAPTKHPTSSVSAPIFDMHLNW